MTALRCRATNSLSNKYLLRVMKIIHETMKTLKKITFGRVLGLIAVLCLCWVSILVSVEFYAARKSSEYQSDVYSSMYDMSGKCGVIDKKGTVIHNEAVDLY